jgi:anti-sigma B factor antagonist
MSLDHCKGDTPTTKVPTMSDFTRSEGLLPLRCTVTWPQPAVCVVHLAGELDIATTPVLADYLREQTAACPAELILDLSGVTLLAAAAVALIVNAIHDSGGIHGRLHVIGVTGNRPVERVLDLMSLRPLLDVHDSVQALLDEFDRR